MIFLSVFGASLVLAIVITVSNLLLSHLHIACWRVANQKVFADQLLSRRQEQLTLYSYTTLETTW